MRAVVGSVRSCSVFDSFFEYSLGGVDSGFFSACATCVVILATKSFILFSSFECLASMLYWRERTTSVGSTDIPLSPRVSRLPQTSEYYIVSEHGNPSSG